MGAAACSVANEALGAMIDVASASDDVNAHAGTDVGMIDLIPCPFQLQRV